MFGKVGKEERLANKSFILDTLEFEVPKGVQSFGDASYKIGSE